METSTYPLQTQFVIGISFQQQQMCMNVQTMLVVTPLTVNILCPEMFILIYNWPYLKQSPALKCYFCLPSISCFRQVSIIYYLLYVTVCIWQHCGDMEHDFPTKELRIQGLKASLPMHCVKATPISLEVLQ